MISSCNPRHVCATATVDKTSENGSIVAHTVLMDWQWDVME